MTQDTAANVINRPHFVLIPLMAQGHMIPMVDLARLLAERGGALVTFVTTPVNAARIKPIIDRAEQSGLSIRFLTLRFPCAEAGLPEGCESADALPSKDLLRNFFEASYMLQAPLTLHLRAQTGPPPSCILADFCHPWAHGLARELGVPRLVFHGFGCFALLCMRNIRIHKIHDGSEDAQEPCLVPGLPHRVLVSKAQSPGFSADPSMLEYREKILEAEEWADGVVVNSFDDLEPSYREWYENATGKRVWTVGPMSLRTGDTAELGTRGNKAAIDPSLCLSWLEPMKPGSVLYVSFGSLARTKPAQLVEIGLALEASGCPFIWVIKAGDKLAQVEEWLSDGFEERTSRRGLVIRGWAPQAMILSHPAVGGFMTHCGWNSTLEALSAGVPLVTWPQFAEQFLNEKLAVEVLRVAVPVGVKSPAIWWSESDENLVGKAEIEKAVRSLMEEGDHEIRERARELAKAARAAMGEGETSHTNLIKLVETMS